ncbi:MAG: hypothetical protein NC252_02140 [Roseburia sp.]|nr:hypothetical protein [Roseburia sp.]MCM1420073.1 hypothetical protein [Bacteroides sp.]
MKKLMLFFIAVLIMGCLNAQQTGKSDNRRKFTPEEFKQRMEAFITKHAGLTPQEGLAFYPLLHEMLGKQHKLMDQQRNLMRKGDNNLSEKEYEKIIEEATSLEIENKKVEKLYYNKFHTVLSWRKIHKVRHALFQFNMEALRNFSPPRNAGNRMRPTSAGKHSGK